VFLKRRLFTVFLCLVLIFSVFPVSVFAKYNPETDTYSGLFDGRITDWMQSTVAGVNSFFTGADYNNVYSTIRFLTTGSSDGKYKYGDTGASSSGADNNYIYNITNNNQTFNTYNEHKVFNTVNNTWYNPINVSYETINNISYSPTYNTYYVTSGSKSGGGSKYESYVTNNITYISYYITDTETSSTWYYEIYYLLPDGRNSYDLTAEDVWGTYFLYDAVNYDEVIEDDGTTLALLHFDGNILDSSAHNNAVNYTSNASYNFIDSDFTSALSWSDSTAHTMTVALPEPLSGDFTIEGRIKVSDASDKVFTTYLPNGDLFDNTTKTYTYDVSLSGRKTFMETRLGSGGSYSVNPTTSYLEYIVTGESDWIISGIGSGVLFLDGESFFKGNESEKRVYSGCKGFTPNVSSYNTIYFSNVAPFETIYSYSQTLDEVLSFAFVRSGDTVTYYENGLEKYSFEYAGTDCETLTLESTAKQSIVFDELRVSNMALYTDTYTPSSQPFDTNLVLVLPDQGEVNQIAVKSNTSVADLRVGGVRPTYPSNGDVYVYLEEDVVKDVQQYQTDGWYSVDACIYEEDAGWTSFANYDLSAYVSEAPEEDDDGSGSGGAGDSGNTGDGSGDSSGGGDLNLGTDGILGELISAVFGGVVSAITAALQGLLSIFTALIEFTTGFGSFLRSAFVFIPGEIMSVITAGITLMVVLAVIRFIRG